MLENIKKNSLRCNWQKYTVGFTINDLVVTVGTTVLLILVGISLVGYLGHRSRVVACFENLRQLSVAMSLYEKSNGGRLPYAFIEYNSTKSVSWDRLIYSYGSSGSRQNHFLRCPSDTIPAKGGDPRRTYSMSQHNMNHLNWPPAPENATGVGLWWAPRGQDHARLASLNLTNTLPSITTDMIAAPMETMLLTEQAQSYNVEFSYLGSAIDNPNLHLNTKIIKSSKYHGGKFNYLLADGHVAWLSPLESLGLNDPGFDDPSVKYENIWTLRHD